MRKTLLLFALCCVFSLSAQYKTYKKNVYVKFDNIESEKPDELISIQDSLSFTFKPYSDNFWETKIENNTNQRITIDWDNAIISSNNRSSKIIFSDDRRLFLGSPKQPEVILQNNYSSKRVDALVNFNGSVDHPLYYLKELKRNGTCKVVIILPIIKNDTTKEYEFSFTVFYEKKK